VVVFVEGTACKAVAGGKTAESEIAAAILTLMIVLIGTPNLKAKIHGVTAADIEPVVVEADANLRLIEKVSPLPFTPHEVGANESPEKAIVGRISL